MIILTQTEFPYCQTHCNFIYSFKHTAGSNLVLKYVDYSRLEPYVMISAVQMNSVKLVHNPEITTIFTGFVFPWSLNIIG
jgi:coproporphyrinogen III oxidase-like Fe-S oxidoreductase